MLRVANPALNERQIEAIWPSDVVIGIPERLRAATISAYSTAARASNGKTREAKLDSNIPDAAAASLARRVPWGSSAIP